VSSIHKSPLDFAKLVQTELVKRISNTPSLETLTYIFEIMYFASLKTEEAMSINFAVVYIDPQSPAPNASSLMDHDRWSFVKLTNPVDMTISNIIKIAKATDLRSSSLAIYPNAKGEVLIWGFIDLGNIYYTYHNYESLRLYEKPGIFQASVFDLGRMIIYHQFEKIAELNVYELSEESIDVFRNSPIRYLLDSGISDWKNKIDQAIPEHMSDYLHDPTTVLHTFWISALCRLLLRTQNYRHGGAILISPKPRPRSLNIKYKLKYSRLRSALELYGEVFVRNRYTSDLIEQYLKDGLNEIPAELYSEVSLQNIKLGQLENELNGVICIISLLTRVDGLVLMNPTLDVLGFGAEIKSSKDPSAVLLALDEWGFIRDRIDPRRFGMRHRSMMRYCSQNPDSIGFVISQDGDVRVMTKRGENIIMWENIRLQNENFILNTS